MHDQSHFKKQRAFVWEGFTTKERNDTLTPSFKQDHILIIVAESKEKAIAMFYEKEHGDKSYFKGLLDYIFFDEPLELSSLMTELILVDMIFSNNTMDNERDLREGKRFHKTTKMTPGRIVYMLASVEDSPNLIKQREKKKKMDEQLKSAMEIEFEF